MPSHWFYNNYLPLKLVFLVLTSILTIFWFYGLWPLNDAWPWVLGLMYVEFLMFVLTPADGLCCIWFIYPVWCWLWCLEAEISSVGSLGNPSVHRVRLQRCCPLNGASRGASSLCIDHHLLGVLHQEVGNCSRKWASLSVYSWNCMLKQEVEEVKA
jgi:hypothetical protein